MARVTHILAGMLTVAALVGLAGCAKTPTTFPSSSVIATSPTSTASPTSPSWGSVTPSAPGGSDAASSSDEPPSTPAPTDSTTPAVPLSVTVVRADVSGTSVTIAAFVPDLVEDGGTCAAVAMPASGGGTPVQATSSAFANAQSTQCGELDITGLTSGNWTLTVSYTSPTHQAVSTPQQIGIA